MWAGGSGDGEQRDGMWARLQSRLSIRIDFRADIEAMTFRVRDQGAGFERYHRSGT
jgi:hypothetical protein